VKHRLVQPNVFIPVIAVILFAATAVHAQQPVNPLVAGMGANAKQLKQYRFKQRTETYHDGELKSAKTDEVFYSSNGERNAIQIDERVLQSDGPKRGPGHRLIAKKI